MKSNNLIGWYAWSSNLIGWNLDALKSGDHIICNWNAIWNAVCSNKRTLFALSFNGTWCRNVGTGTLGLVAAIPCPATVFRIYFHDLFRLIQSFVGGNTVAGRFQLAPIGAPIRETVSYKCCPWSLNTVSRCNGFIGGGEPIYRMNRLDSRKICPSMVPACALETSI